MFNRISWKHLLITAALLLALAACTTAKAAPQTAPQTVVSEPVRSITVVGSGEIKLVPDVAQINIGVDIAKSTVAEAKAQVDQQIVAVLAALKSFGIADKDIQTSNYSIYYERDPYAPTGEGKGEGQGVYRVSNTLQVTLRDINKVGDVLDAAIAAGANQVYGVSLTVSDTQKWQSEAREKAISDAKARAQELARLTGVTLDQVLVVSEVVGGSAFPVAYERGAYGMGGSGVMPGELTFSTQVQVTFAIR